MAEQSFVSEQECFGCPDPPLAEYAPPDRLRLSNTIGGDSWYFYLLLGDDVYFSNEGKRWLTGTDSVAATIGIIDPRRLVDWTLEETVEGKETIDGDETTVVAATLEVEAFIDGSFVALDTESEAALRDVFGDLGLRFWIASDGRVLQIEVFRPGDDSRLQRFDFDVAVDLPETVESMSYEQVQRLGQELEQGGEALLLAIGRYERANGRYPPELDEESLRRHLQTSWPANPFFGRPMRHDPESPGDFSYRLKDGGSNIEFRVNDWDGARLYYDSQRFGPIAIQ